MDGGSVLEEISRNNYQTFNASIKTNGSNNISDVKLEKFKVLDKDGNDVTENFSIELRGGTHVRIKATDTLENGDYTITYTETLYDGQEHTAEMTFHFSGKGVSYILTNEKKISTVL